MEERFEAMLTTQAKWIALCRIDVQNAITFQVRLSDTESIARSQLA